MSSKRHLKKRINDICNNLADDIQHAAFLHNDIDEQKVCDVLTDIARLQVESLAKVTFAFDKSAKDFETRRAYRAAMHKYKAAAYAKLRKEFADSAFEIVKRMNQLFPAEVRRLVSPQG